MKMNNFFKAGYAIVRAVVVLAAAFLVVYGAYVILDTITVEKNAFVSSEILKYKPSDGTSSTISYGLNELEEINRDVIGWLEINGTNVDYPVVQGEDELEYANKDVFGRNSMTGSIYLSSGNDSDFSDFYNIIYGHNMEAGAMFGDIAKYTDESYFNAHRTGTLYSDNQSYEFKIYAVLKTDAYRDEIYSSNAVTKENASDKIDFINENMLYGDKKSLSELTKVLVFSTCEQADTNGRVVVVADAVLSDKVYSQANSSDGGKRNSSKKPLEHKVDSWSLVNFLSMVGSVLTMFPILYSVRKYGMFNYSKKVKNEIENDFNFIERYMDEDQRQKDNIQEILMKAIKKFRRKITMGTLIEAVMLAASVITFLLTEDITRRVDFVDMYTPFMIAMFAVSLAADIACFTYRGEELPEVINAIITGELSTETEFNQ